MIKRVWFLMAPIATGKSTIAGFFRKRYNFPVLSTKEELAKRDPSFNAGSAALSSDEKVIKVTEQFLAEHPEIECLVVDSVRSVAQARWWRHVGAPGAKFYLVYVDVKDEVPRARLKSRSPRPDDERFEERLSIYRGYEEDLTGFLKPHCVCIILKDHTIEETEAILEERCEKEFFTWPQ